MGESSTIFTFFELAVFGFAIIGVLTVAWLAFSSVF